ncbi:MAG: hypothetical protein R3B13_11460 [Polyangiaceae bacterium]
MRTRILIGIAGIVTLALAFAATALEPRHAGPPLSTPQPRGFKESRPQSDGRSSIERVVHLEQVVQLEELRIVANRRRKAPRSAVAQPEPKLVPCSDWRALGPVYSAPEGTIPRQRHVQLLCPESEVRR